MSTPRWARSSLALLIATAAGAVLAQGPDLGEEITPGDIAAWDITVMPDGSGLPSGRGTPAQGAAVFAQKCAACHGDNGKGGTNSALVSDRRRTSIDAAEKTIPNFWPYASSLFDYIRRAMPWQLPRSLSDDEVYALTAFLLAENKLIGPSELMDASSLPKVRMPNRDGFIVRFPELM
jgi:hypothetical protein